MGRLRIAAAALLAVAILSSSALASGFENTGIGVQARAMGGAFRAIANDWTAAMYNPAGYAWIKDNQLGGNSAFLHYRNELTPNYRLGGEYETGIFNDVALYNTHQIISNPSGGFLLRLPFWGESVIGMSAYQRFDYDISWQLYSPLRAYNDSVDTEIPVDQFRNNLDVVTFQATFAREFIPEKLAIGLGLQINRGDLIFRNLTFRTTPMESGAWIDEPYRKIPELSGNDGNGWGFGFSIGMIYKITPKLNMALTGNVPFDITIDGTAEQLFIMPRISPLLRPGTTVVPGTASRLFASGDIVEMTSDFTTKLQLPPSMALALAYDVTPKLTLALDAEYTIWSRFRGFDFDYSNFVGLPIILDDPAKLDFFTVDLSSQVEWKNAGKIAGGFSYDALNYLTVLGGVSADQSANRDAIGFIPQFVDTGDKLGINGGVLFHVQRWDLGLAVSYIDYPDLDVTVLDKNLDEVYEGFPGQYKASTYETILSFNYRF